MLSLLKKLLTIICFLLLQKTIVAERLNFKIVLPQNLDDSKILLMIDDGLGQKMTPIKFENHIGYITNDIKSTYATLVILYPETENRLYSARFLINAKSTVVFFSKVDTMQNPLANYTLKNAIDVDKCKEFLSLKSHAKKEFETNAFYANEYSKLSSDSSILNYNNSSRQLALKAIGYIKEHGKNYFSFWYFRTEIANELLKTNQLELYEIFNTAFPVKFQQSYEGKSLKALIEGNLFVKKGNAAPLLTVKDYKGKVISSDSFRGKYVLLAFWATWCKPCVEEIPLLKKIRALYPEEKLQIISVSCDKDSMAFIKKITESKMDWTHVFGNNNLQNLFGNKPIPALYLIDPKGVIAFSRWEDEEEKLQEILKENIKNQ